MATDPELQEKFRHEIRVVIDKFLDEAGMHAADMIEPLKTETKWCEDAVRTTDRHP